MEGGRGRTDERTDGRTEERTDERTEGRTDGRTMEHTGIQREGQSCRVRQVYAGKEKNVITETDRRSN